MQWVRRGLLALIFAGLLYVCIQFPKRNAAPVDVDVLALSFQAVPLWLVLLSTFGAGVVLALLLAFYQVTKARMLTRRYRKTARGLEAEIHQLRSLPLAGAEPAGDAGIRAPGERAFEGGA